MDATTRWTAIDATVVLPTGRNGVSTQVVEGECLLTDSADGSTIFLNETAAMVWTACDGTTSMREVATRIADRYDVTTDDALVDVEEIAQLFAECGLLALPGAGR